MATPEEFVRIWQAASSVAEVAEKLHVKAPDAASRASRYRKKGIKLKMMPHVVVRGAAFTPDFIAHLNAVIENGDSNANS